MRALIDNFGDWERLRAKLSHNILKNEITPAVFRLCRTYSGRDGILAAFPKVREANVRGTAVKDLANAVDRWLQ